MLVEAVSTTVCPPPIGSQFGLQATTVVKQVNGWPSTSSTSGRLTYGTHYRNWLTRPLLVTVAYKTLACGCAMDQMCEADLLIGLYFDAMAPDAQPECRRSDGKWSRSVALHPSGYVPSCDEPGGVGAGVLQGLPCLMIHQLQVRHGGRPHQQPPILLLPTLGWGRWSLTWLQALSDRLWLSGGSHDPPCAIAALQPGTR